MMGVIDGKGYSLIAEMLPYEDDRDPLAELVVGEVDDPRDETVLTVKTFVKRKDRLSSAESDSGRGCTLTDVPLYDKGTVPNMSSVMSSA